MKQKLAVTEEAIVDNQVNVYEAPSRIHGMGIFAARDLQRGEHVVELDDTRIVREAGPALDHCGHRRYYDDISGGQVVQLGPLQYTNHSCNFNTYTKTIAGTRYRVARRDIRTDEEITSHYCLNARSSGEWECRCGNRNCLGRLVHDYFALPRALQLDYLPYLDDWFMQENATLVRQLRQCSPT